MIEVLNSFWALEFGGAVFQTLAVLESIGYLNLGSRFQDLDKHTDEHNLGSRFQDLDRRTDEIRVSGPR